jgi:ABC-type transporter Mla MlaB component
MAERKRTVTVTVPSPLGRAELPDLFARTCALLSDGRGCGLLLCEVDGVAADAVAVDALARLALAARRGGCEVRLRGASRELLGLVELIGLGAVLRPQQPAERRGIAGGDAAAIAGLPGIATRPRSLPAPRGYW